MIFIFLLVYDCLVCIQNAGFCFDLSDSFVSVSFIVIPIISIIMIPRSKGQKFDASLLAGEFLTLGPAKNMSK